MVAFILLPPTATANKQQSNNQTCSRRALLVSAGVAVGTLLTRAPANAFSLPKIELPNIVDKVKNFSLGTPDSVKDSGKPMDIDTSSLEDKLLEKRKMKKMAATSPPPAPAPEPAAEE